MLKIAITGPESTGKSTLARFLGRYFKCPVSEEYARNYLERKQGTYILEDLTKIAYEQLQSQINASELAEELVIYDTDVLVVKIWSEQKFGYCPGEILEYLSMQKVDFYFLTFHDIAWEPDPLRESPMDRARLFKIYNSELQNMGIPFTTIKGDTFSRNFQTIKEVRKRLSK